MAGAAYCIGPRVTSVQYAPDGIVGCNSGARHGGAMLRTDTGAAYCTGGARGSVQYG